MPNVPPPTVDPCIHWAVNLSAICSGGTRSWPFSLSFHPTKSSSNAHHAALVQWGLCANVKVHSKFPPSLVILWIELGGKPKWLPLNFGYHGVMRTGPNTLCYSVIAQQMWDRSSPIRGHLKSSHIADKRKNFHMALYPLPPSSNESVIDNGRNVWQMAMHIILVLPNNCSNNVVCLTQGRFPGSSASIAKWTRRLFWSWTVEEKYDFYFSFFFCTLKSGWPV